MKKIILLLLIFLIISSVVEAQKKSHKKKSNKKSQQVDKIQAELLDNLEEDLQQFVIPNPVAPLPIDQLKDIMVEDIDRSQIEEDLIDADQFVQFTDKVISQVEEELIKSDDYPDTEELDFLENIKQLVVQPNNGLSHESVMTPVGGYNLLELSPPTKKSKGILLQKIDFYSDEDEGGKKYYGEERSQEYNSDSLKFLNNMQNKFESIEKNAFKDFDEEDLQEEIEKKTKAILDPFDLPEFNMEEYQNPYDEYTQTLPLIIPKKEDNFDIIRDGENLELTLDQKNKLFADLGGFEAKFDINLYDDDNDDDDDFLKKPQAKEIKKEQRIPSVLFEDDFQLNPDAKLKNLPNIFDDIENLDEVLETPINPQNSQKNNAISPYEQSLLEMDNELAKLESTQFTGLTQDDEVAIDQIVEQNKELEDRISKEVQDIEKLLKEIDIETADQPPPADPQYYYVPEIKLYDVPMYTTAKETVVTIGTLDRKLDEETLNELEEEAEYKVLEQLEEKIYQAEKAKEELEETGQYQGENGEDFNDDMFEGQERVLDSSEPEIKTEEIQSEAIVQRSKEVEANNNQEFLAINQNQTPLPGDPTFDIKKVVIFTAIFSLAFVIFLKHKAGLESNRRNSRDDNL